MMFSDLPLTTVKTEAERAAVKTERRVFSCIELCKIIAVDVKSRTVAVYFFDSKTTKEKVPYSFPSYNGGTGIITVPMVNAIGVAAWDSHGLPIIIAFTAPISINQEGRLTRNLPHLKAHNLPELLEGEVLISSGGRSFMRFDSVGGIRLSSALFASIYLDEDGNGTIDLENGYININGVLEETYTHNFMPVCRVVKGRHFYHPTQQSLDSVELCYRVAVIDGQEEIAFVGIDTTGTIHVKGNVIYHPVETPGSV